jgi:hypothetical protein
MTLGSRLLLTIAGLCLLSTVPLAAQSNTTSNLAASIPFEFAIGGKTMPAGDYIVRCATNGIVKMEAVGGRESEFALGYNKDYSAHSADPKLTFRRYADRYFLASVAPGGGNITLELPRSRTEKDVVLSASVRPAQTVTIAANRIAR